MYPVAARVNEFMLFTGAAATLTALVKAAGRLTVDFNGAGRDAAVLRFATDAHLMLRPWRGSVTGCRGG